MDKSLKCIRKYNTVVHNFTITAECVTAGVWG